MLKKLLCAAFLFTSAAAFAQPANDSICNAPVLPIGAFAAGETTIDATVDSMVVGLVTLASETPGACFAVGATPGSADRTVWYEIQVPVSGHGVLSFTNTDFNIEVALYSSDNDACDGALTEAYCLTAASGVDTALNVCTTPGQIYFVQVDVDGAAGNFDIRWIDGANILTPTMSFVPVTCFQGADGIAIAAGAGQGPHTYVWQDSLGNELSNQPNANPDSLMSLSAAEYFVTVTDAEGCIKMDSVTVTQPSNFPMGSSNDTICEGDTFFVGNSEYTMAGSYTDTLAGASAQGCDSIHMTNLTVNPIVRDTIPVTICEDTTVFAEGAEQSTSGFYSDTFTAATGCDSIRTFDLTVLTLGRDTVDTTICATDSIFLQGGFQDTAGVYRDTLENASANGCDSVVVTNLFITPNDTVVVDTAICANDSIFLQGAWQDTAGTYFDTTFAPCLVVTQTNLTINPTFNDTFTYEICEGDTVFVGDTAYTEAGFYTDSLSTTAGCDSLVHSDITVVSTVITFDDTTACEGDTVVINGTARTEAGVYRDTFTANSGCDSVVFTTLNLNPSYLFEDTIRICDGDTAEFRGRQETTAGVYNDTFMTTEGCDSIFSTTVEVLSNPFTTFDTIVTCDTTPVVIHGMPRDTNGTYVDTFPSSIGCDSISSVALFFESPSATSLDTVSICDGDTATIRGTEYTTAGVYCDTFVNAAGCDSVVCTELIVNPIDMTNQTFQVCEGDSFFAGGAFQDTSGTYSDTFSNANGCDSIVNTTLIFDTLLITFDTLQVCGTDDSVMVHGNNETVGVYTDTFVASGGCDSISHVIVEDATVDPNFNNVTICEGDSIFAGGMFRDSAGNYVDTFTSINGCDSVVFTTLSIRALPTPLILGDTVICAGETQTLAVNASFDVYQWSTGDSTASIEAGAGFYAVNVTDDIGCEGFALIFVTEEAPITFDLTDDVTIDNGASASLAVSNIVSNSATNVTWSPVDGLDCSNCETVVASPEETTTYVVVVANESNCEASDSVTVTVLAGEADVDFPNSFTPNGDGVNDTYRPYGTGLDLVSFSVFDRWGSEVFRSTQDLKAWNGRFEQQELDPGVYNVVIVTRTRDGEISETRLTSVRLFR